jgi:hypothetical protein
MDTAEIILRSSSYEEVVEMLGPTLAQNEVGFLMDYPKVPDHPPGRWGHHVCTTVSDHWDFLDYKERFIAYTIASSAASTY